MSGDADGGSDGAGPSTKQVTGHHDAAHVIVIPAEPGAGQDILGAYAGPDGHVVTIRKDVLRKGR